MGRFYIFHLSAFVATAEQNNQRISHLAEIHAVSRAEINFKFKDSFSDGLAFAQVACPGTGDSCPDFRATFALFKRFEPLLERASTRLRLVEVRLSRSDFHFESIVACGLHFVK